MVTVVYFAWVRERVGAEVENVTLPADVVTAGDLVAHLSTLSLGHAAALGDRARLRVAVDQVMSDFDRDIRDAHEIALFPPVTGG